jgi:hypothetical protein
VRRQKGLRPATDEVNEPHANDPAGQPERREISPHPNVLQARPRRGAPLRALQTNLAKATEPALRERLAAAVAAIQRGQP